MEESVADAKATDAEEVTDEPEEKKKDQVEEAVEQRLFDLYKRYTKG